MGKSSGNQGFTLVEIMIGCALLAMLALAFAQMMTYQAKQQGNVTVKAAFNQISQGVAAAAADASSAIQSAKAQDTPMPVQIAPSNPSAGTGTTVGHLPGTLPNTTPSAGMASGGVNSSNVNTIRATPSPKGH